MKLKELHIINFKGIPNMSIPFDELGWSANIYGQNEAGKTTIFDAYTWGLFGMDSLSRPTFGIIPSGKERTGVSPTVNEVFEMDDGSYITIERIFKEKWRTPRGEVEPVFDGNTTEYWVTQGDDRISKKEKEFIQFIESLIPANLFKILSVPRHFNEVVDESARRNMLMMLAGTSEADIQASIDRVESLKKERADIASQLKDVKAKIKENQEQLKDVAAFDDTDYGAQLQELQEKKASASVVTGKAEVEAEIVQVRTELQKIKNQEEGKIQTKGFQLSVDIAKVAQSITDIESQISTKRREVQRLLEEEKEALEKHNNNDARYKDTMTWQFTHDEECPKCGYTWSNDGSNEEDFNKEKSDRLESIKAEDDKLKARYKELQEKGKALNDEINKLSKQLPELQKQKEELEAEFNNSKEMLKSIESLPEYTDTAAKLEPLEQRLSALSEGNVVDTSAIDQEIEDTKAKIRTQVEARAANQQRDDRLARIKHLESEQKELGKKHEETQAKLAQAEESMRDTSVSLEEPINSRFKHISYRMTKTLENGSIVTCCEAMSKGGVPYHDMSNSQKIRSGLEVIKALSEYYGIHVPIWIDNKESCDHLIELDGLQVISLIVSGEDKELRIEGVK